MPSQQEHGSTRTDLSREEQVKAISHGISGEVVYLSRGDVDPSQKFGAVERIIASVFLRHELQGGELLLDLYSYLNLGIRHLVGDDTDPKGAAVVYANMLNQQATEILRMQTQQALETERQVQQPRP
jgi:hypothetical protein